jgi:hypothetical protein
VLRKNYDLVVNSNTLIFRSGFALEGLLDIELLPSRDKGVNQHTRTTKRTEQDKEIYDNQDDRAIIHSPWISAHIGSIEIRG